MLQILLIRPGATDFDEQGRIKGSLDVPLNQNGNDQVAKTIGEVVKLPINHIYCSPCQSAMQTADALGEKCDVKAKEVEKLQNLDHGLWHGKRIEEVKQSQPKVYRQWQEHPETVCPPGGETLDSAQQRVRTVLAKLLKKHKKGVVALVVPEPLASLVSCLLESRDLGDLWKAECDTGGWERIEIEPKTVVLS